MKRSLRVAALLLAAALLPALCACGPVIDPNYGKNDGPLRPVETAPTERPELWTGVYDASGELMDALGVDLRARLREPVSAEVRLEIDTAGRCSLRCDWSPCLDALRPALAGLLRELQEQEADNAPAGEPDALAAALIEELLPRPLLLLGTLSEDKSEIRWGFGRVSELSREGDRLRLDLPELGEVLLSLTEE